jgi:hypothetical protein
LADEKRFLHRVGSTCVGLLRFVDIGMQHFGTGQKVFAGLIRKRLEKLDVFGRDALSDISKGPIVGKVINEFGVLAIIVGCLSCNNVEQVFYS